MAGPGHELSLNGRLRSLLVMIVVAFVTMAGVSLAVVSLTHRGDEEKLRLVRAQLLLATLDELNEALRAELLSLTAAGGADATDRQVAWDELAELRHVVDEADLAWMPSNLLSASRRIVADERTYADLVAAALDGDPDVTRHVVAARVALAPMTREIDAMRGRLTVATEEHDRHATTWARWMFVGMVATAVVLTALTGLLARRRLLSGLRAAMDQLQVGFGHQERREKVARALEQTDSEQDVHQVVARGTALIFGDAASCLFIVDSSEVHLERVACSDAPESSCGVDSPAACPAMRGSRTVSMVSNNDLDSCPRLRDRPGHEVSAACTPLTFLGRSLGVVQVLGPPGVEAEPERLKGLRDIADLAGARLGTMRSLAFAQRQATLDPLTGLLNRRTLEDRVRAITDSGTSYAVAMLDLDLFKQLNDTHGHEAGDSALKLFSKTLRTSLRTQDIVARIGGEEFVVVMPGAGSGEALEALMHVRATLARTVATTGVPFTFSGGISDTQMSDSWQHLLRTADAGLMSAKVGGRDRLVISNSLQRDRRTPDRSTEPV